MWGLLLNVAIAARFVRCCEVKETSGRGWRSCSSRPESVFSPAGEVGCLILAALLLIVYLAERGKLPIRWLLANRPRIHVLVAPILDRFTEAFCGTPIPAGWQAGSIAASAAFRG
jgi:hypothetical protein